MSDLRDPAPASTAADLPLTSPVSVPSSPLVRFGGLLGILGIVLGLGLLVVGCAGYSQALALSPGPAGLGALGLLIVITGALFQKRRLAEDTHVLQAVFACLMALIGGVLEMAIWLKWPMFK